MKKLLYIIGSLLAAIFIVVYLPQIARGENAITDTSSQGRGIYGQQVKSVEKMPQMISVLYNKGNCIGVFKDTNILEKHLEDRYNSLYLDTYPNTKLALSEDVYISEEMSFFKYEDIDQKLLEYIEKFDLYSLETTEVSFADNNDVYARIYVKDRELYEQAFNTYISYFVDEKSLALINQGVQAPSLTAPGSQATGISIPQNILINKGYAKPDEILTTEEEVLEFLKYGDNTEREYYTVQQYDTVAGVGSRSNGLTAEQVMNINRDKISSVDQALKEGEELCVTYFTSPIDVQVTMEEFRQEPVYFTTSYVEDDEMIQNTSEVKQEGYNGLRNAIYEETWVNGILVSGVEESSVIVQEAEPEIVAIGTQALPDVGTGDYRWPVDNPSITCPWGCYFGHKGTDIINRYEAYGKIYAVDNGVVVINSYTSINGNYVVIDHNNGIRSYYGHMNVPSPLEIGTVVQKGDVIGQIGMTGWATGPHVHFNFDDGEENNRINACDGFLDCESLR